MTDSRDINRISQRWGGKLYHVHLPACFYAGGERFESTGVDFHLFHDIDLGGRVQSAYVELNGGMFDYQSLGTFSKVLAERGYRLISLEEVAILRILGGANIDGPVENKRFPLISDKSYTAKEAFVYIPGKGLYLTRNSPLAEEPKEIVERSRCDVDYGKEHYLTDEQVEKALANAVKVSDHPENEITPIPTQRFAESEIANWAFGGAAEDYGALLSYCGITSMPINWARSSEEGKPFTRPATLCDLWFPLCGEREGYSSLSGRYINPRRVRGIKVQEADTKLGRFLDKIIPTDFESYLLRPKKRIEAGKNPAPTADERNKTGIELINTAVGDLARELVELEGGTVVEDPHPEIAELSDAFGFTPEEEGRVRTAYGELKRNLTGGDGK